MKPAGHNGAYDAYLLRIWRGDRENDWRWMLQNIRTGEQKGFPDMGALVEYLGEVYREADDGSGRLTMQDE